MDVTAIGGPTMLLELDGWRLIVDPTFDPAGGRYPFALGTASTKTVGPAVAAADLGPIDAALVSHDQHADNLDAAGRRLLERIPVVITTRAAARRLRHPDARGLAPGRATALAAPGRPTLVVTATPARHGPPLSRPILGPVVGFAISRVGTEGTRVWLTGDTVASRRVRRAASRLAPDVMVVNAGGVAFGITGRLRYTMTGIAAARLVEAAAPRVAIPAHVEGWSHFVDGVDGMRAGLAHVPAARAVTRWLQPGEAVSIPEPDGPARSRASADT
ncbi:MBL fold metallo-hydrolase [Demequina sp. NBRC 110057]|uniref:MBL fold metallo-hydrolase n=1 Tax=Demequina sp. NBRC 110057 TaxID=1570346 RepID=UPI000A016527|nr:MBL fold metallo-hydrolase [Demequina sp. NBRC 110057]